MCEIALPNYDAELTSKGVKTVYRYGVAFSGKNVEVTVLKAKIL